MNPELPPTWAIFDGFALPRRAHSWVELDELIDRGFAYAQHRCGAFPTLVEQWNTCLSSLGGDPCITDWSHFRPLQADREEDWSDWLQHFIATSTTGRLGQCLFGRCGFAELKSWARPSVIREDVAEDRRADLVIRWHNGARTHVEVKVGDLSLSKARNTAIKLEQKYPGTWNHYLLLPSEDAEYWDDDNEGEPTVTLLTWEDVALALRRALREQQEHYGWLAWAHGFCGLVEQKLLGHPVGKSGVEGLSDMERRLRQIALMQKGLEDG